MLNKTSWKTNRIKLWTRPVFNVQELRVICQVAWIESIRNPFQNKWMFPNIVNPPIIHLNWVFHFEPSILGVPPFSETPMCTLVLWKIDSPLGFSSRQIDNWDFSKFWGPKIPNEWLQSCMIMFDLVVSCWFISQVRDFSWQLIFWRVGHSLNKSLTNINRKKMMVWYPLACMISVPSLWIIDISIYIWHRLSLAPPQFPQL